MFLHFELNKKTKAKTDLLFKMKIRIHVIRKHGRTIKFNFHKFRKSRTKFTGVMKGYQIESSIAVKTILLYK